MADGFVVDLTSLVKAAEGVNGVATDMQNNKVADIGGRAADYGDGGLGGVMADFCARWEIGVEHLTNDAKGVAGGLMLSAQAYAKAEHASIAAISGVLKQSSGDDPAASSW